MYLADNCNLFYMPFYRARNSLRQTPLTFGTAKQKSELSSCEEFVQIKITT